MHSKNLKNQRGTPWMILLGAAGFHLLSLSGGGAADPPFAVEPSAPDRALPHLTETSVLSDYLVYAALNNSELEGAFHRWQAAVERIAQARALPDPKLSYGYYIREVETRVGPQQHRLGLSQMVPWFGKLKLRGEMAGAEAAALEHQFEAVKRKLHYQVKDAWYELAYLKQAIIITEDNMQLLRDIEEVAQTRLKAGGAMTGVLKSQVELGKLSDRLRSLQDLRRPIAAKLNAALNRPSEAPLPWPSSLPEESVHLSEEQLTDGLSEHNPELQGLASHVAREQKSLALARKEYYPDLTLGVDYIETGEAMNPSMEDSGKDAVVAMVSINLPLWFGKYRAGVREAAARQEAAREAQAQRENTLQADLKLALYRYRDAERKVGLYRDTLGPLAESALNVARRAWEAGEVDFMELIDAQRLLLEFQLEAKRALADRAQRLAEIEMMAGREVWHAVGTDSNLASPPVQEALP